VKLGIVVIAELSGDVAARIHDIQKRYDPRMAAELPPHITLTGSSGMGPIAVDTPVDALRTALGPVASGTAPFDVRLDPPMRFMQSVVVVLPIPPHGPIRALHEAIKSSGLAYDPPRFTFTPHCTLSFYPELARDRLRDLLTVRIDDPITIDSIQAYRTIDLTRTEKLIDLPLTG
jgi:2'-5' RNA ligase